MGYNEGLDKHVANDGSWHDTADGAQQADERYANSSGGGGGGGAGWGSMSGLGGTLVSFALIGFKLAFLLIKYGVLQSFVVGLGSCAFAGIFYSLITKTQFIANGTAYYITLAIIFTVSMIGWNIKKLRKIFVAMVAVCGIGFVYVVLTGMQILSVPAYMIPVNLPENFVAREKSGGFTHVLNEAGDGVIIMKYSSIKRGDVVVPDEINGVPVIAIGERAFRGSALTSIVIPEGVTDIGNEAFSQCPRLASVTLPKSLKRVGFMAFEKCASLVDVTIPSGSKIMYGFFGERNESGTTHIEWMGKYFRDGQLEDGYLHSFIRCPNLSADSQQAIKASGYKGRFLEPGD